MSDTVGWVATILTASSYFTRRQVVLRRTQALAAGLWMVYGALIHSMPVVAANVIVGGVALWSSFRSPAPAAAAGDAVLDRRASPETRS